MMKYTLYALVGLAFCFSNFAYAQSESLDVTPEQNTASVMVGSGQNGYQNMRIDSSPDYGMGQVSNMMQGRANIIVDDGWSPSSSNYKNNNKNMMGYNQFGGYEGGMFQCGNNSGMMRGVFGLFVLILVIAVLFFIFRKFMHHKKHHHCKSMCNCGCNCECCCECKCMDSMNMVRDRFARGEIDIYEFEEKKKALTQ